MFRLVSLAGLILLGACATSKSIHHFAKGKGLTVKTASNINFFNGSIEIETAPDPMDKNIIYLLYSGDSLQYVSTDKRVINNDFIYKIQKLSDSLIMLTRGSLFPRYYTVDTVLFHHDLAIAKKSLYEGDRVFQSDFETYQFSNDTLTTSSYRSADSSIQVLKFKAGLNSTTVFAGKPSDVQRYPGQNRKTFFKSRIW